jgi:hypothetical protein
VNPSKRFGIYQFYGTMTADRRQFFSAAVSGQPSAVILYAF